MGQIVRISMEQARAVAAVCEGQEGEVTLDQIFLAPPASLLRVTFTKGDYIQSVFTIDPTGDIVTDYDQSWE